MKNLANCSPREFLRQTSRIRKAVSNWLSLTKIMEIRKRLPKLPDNISEDEKNELIRKQIDSNFNAIFDTILDEHPDETAELLGLVCFVEPDDLDNHPMTEFLGSAAEILNNREVMNFFISLAKLGSRSGSVVVKA